MRSKKKIRQRLRQRIALLPFFPEGSEIPQYTVPIKTATTVAAPAATEVVAEAPAVKREPVRQYVRGQKFDFSTKGALNTKKISADEAAETVKSGEKRDADVTEEAIFSLWMRFPSQIKDKYALHPLFSKTPSWETENKTISVTVGNVIARELEEVLPLLTRYMRGGLKNDNIEIKIDIEESTGEGRDLSPVGKARAMAEKNDKLRELCRRLNLEFA